MNKYCLCALVGISWCQVACPVKEQKVHKHFCETDYAITTTYTQGNLSAFLIFYKKTKTSHYSESITVIRSSTINNRGRMGYIYNIYTENEYPVDGERAFNHLAKIYQKQQKLENKISLIGVLKKGLKCLYSKIPKF